jgi:hypothetical protein
MSSVYFCLFILIPLFVSFVLFMVHCKLSERSVQMTRGAMAEPAGKSALCALIRRLSMISVPVCTSI